MKTMIIATVLLAGCASPAGNGGYSFALLPVDFGYPKYEAPAKNKQICAEEATNALVKDGGSPEDIEFRRAKGIQRNAYNDCMKSYK